MSGHTPTSDPSESTPKELYERVLNVVDYQTSPEQLPGVRPGTVTLVLCEHAGEDREAVRNALNQAETNGDLLFWRDADGHLRATRCTETDLKRLLGYFNTKLRASAEACRRVAAAIREVQDG